MMMDLLFHFFAILILGVYLQFLLGLKKDVVVPVALLGAVFVTLANHMLFPYITYTNLRAPPCAPKKEGFPPCGCPYAQHRMSCPFRRRIVDQN